MHEWIVDSNFTPHLVIDANAPGVFAPEGYAREGKLIVNVSPQATQSLSLGNEEVAFTARFGGVPRDVRVPVTAVLAVYARENGQGVVFSSEDEAEAPPAESEDGQQEKPASDGRPHLRVVK